MGYADWGELSNSLTTAEIRRGVTGAGGDYAPPPGGGSFVYGWNSVDGTVTGAHGKFVDLTDFNPMTAGGSIRAALKRIGGAGNTGFSPFLFFGAQSSPPDVNDQAYILGLEDADPYRIVLRKGLISEGVPEADDDNSLRRSSDQFQVGDDIWIHLRLDVIAQPNGDVTLQVFRNAFTGGHDVQNQSWAAIDGMAEITDDVLAALTGSEPLVGGFSGYGFRIAESISRRAAADHIELLRA